MRSEDLLTGLPRGQFTLDRRRRRETSRRAYTVILFVSFLTPVSLRRPATRPLPSVKRLTGNRSYLFLRFASLRAVDPFLPFHVSAQRISDDANLANLLLDIHDCRSIAL